jgi:membrane-bound lytic murein transglycosylase MltF
VIAESRYWWGFDFERKTVFFAQIHQESGWDPEAKSPYASGLAQFTPDTADWISRLYPADLGDNNPLDVRWAIRALVKMDRWLHEKFPNAITENDRWAFVLSSYNSGLGWTLKERKSAQGKGKNIEQWWCSVQHELVKSKRAFDESRAYVDKILFRWSPLYRSGGF